MLPDDALSPFPSNKVQAVARLVELDRAAVEVCSKFQDAGVPALLLKGPSFAQWLYRDDPRQRPYSDVDVLAQPAPHNALLLTELGFIQTGVHPRGVHTTWVRETDNVTVELHGTLLGIGCGSDAAWTVLSNHIEQFCLIGNTIFVFDEIARTLHVCLHAAGDPGPRTREDLVRAIRFASPDAWARAADLARSLEASDAFTVGLRSTPEGAAIADRLALREAAPLGLTLRAAGASNAAQMLGEMHDAAGIREKVSIARRAVRGRSLLRVIGSGLRAIPEYLRARH